MCGEKQYEEDNVGVQAGSPPRVRGKGMAGNSSRKEVRITPACAGKSRSTGSPRTDGWDHPRVCGEKPAPAGQSLIYRGSPPRVRGKVCIIRGRARVCRITPACAGKRRNPRKLPHPERDHPRVCGEKGDLVPIYLDEVGSPPRVRGKVPKAPRHLGRGGITPACAGKSKRLACCAQQAEDHPRVCGEKHFGQGSGFQLVGSPPRVRGKEACKKACEVSWGITPACAGKRRKNCG